MSYHNENNDNESSWVTWIIIIVICYYLFNHYHSKPEKSYNSDVYSSWEEERIDELEADVAYLLNKLEK